MTLTSRDFIERIRSIAAEFPGINPEATAAHAANESRYGRSELSEVFRNIFGIKATESWRGETVLLPTWEVVNGQVIQTSAMFRVYETWAHSVEDYADIINRVYPWTVAHSNHPLGHLAGLFIMGDRKWATDPQAFFKCVKILEQFGLLEQAPGRYSLGRHELLVDNSPMLVTAFRTLSAALIGKPAIHGPVYATRTRREDGSWKLDIRGVPKEEE